MSKLKKLWCNNQLVMTTEQVAETLGTDSVRIWQSFSRNDEYFIEGIHYYKLTGENLKAVKALLGGEQLPIKMIGSWLKLTEEAKAADWSVPEPTIDKRAPHMMLWTRRGLMRHVKVIDTPQAWAIYDRMEDVYFHVLEGDQPRLKTSAKTEELPRAKSKYWRGQRVWTVQDVLEMYPMLTKDHIKYAAENVLTREDTYVLRGAELRQYKCENGMMKCKALRLVTERGLTKLAAYYNVEAAPSEAPAVTNFAEKINTAIRAMEAVTNVLRSLTA